MREDYAFKTDATEVKLKLEVKVAELLTVMAKHTKLSEAEIANTAIKRFIATHRDFIPEKSGGSRSGS